MKKYTWLLLACSKETTGCYVEEDRTLNVGDLVTLKTSDNPDKWWRIESIGDPVTKTLAQKEKSEKFYQKDFLGRAGLNVNLNTKNR